VKQKVSIAIFWALIVVAAVSLVRITREDWRGSLRTAAFVVPFVLLTGWLRSRFKGPKRRMATIMIYSALFAMVTGSMVVWELTLLRVGFQERSNLVEAIAASAAFVVSSLVLVWSLLRLLGPESKLPT
jgi:FtsH-binding integral membrane protein